MAGVLRKSLVALALVLLGSACATQPMPVDQRNSALTQGNVQMNIRVGETTKADILEVFGGPNVTTRDASGQEVWSYQRAATIVQSQESSNYWTVILTGGSNTAAGFQQTQSMITLIIKFDANDVVSDFRSRTSTF
jgi:outer membrane protein assembly factor BamE (lipoprotein component of BamABCDE complex)